MYRHAVFPHTVPAASAVQHSAFWLRLSVEIVVVNCDRAVEHTDRTVCSYCSSLYRTGCTERLTELADVSVLLPVRLRAACFAVDIAPSKGKHRDNPSDGELPKYTKRSKRLLTLLLLHAQLHRCVCLTTTCFGRISLRHQQNTHSYRQIKRCKTQWLPNRPKRIVFLCIKLLPDIDVTVFGRCMLDATCNKTLQTENYFQYRHFAYEVSAFDSAS
jgi:hypothetical protein